MECIQSKEKHMRQLFYSIAVLVFAGALTAASAQVKPTILAGDAASVAEGKIAITTKTGTVEVAVNEKTAYKKVPADNPTGFTSAANAAFGDIAVGDKLTISVIIDADGKSQPARTIYFISNAEIAARNAKDSAEWQRRGINGKVTAVNAQTNQVTIENRTLMATTSVVITPKDGAKVLRYAPDSVRFDEALASSVGDMKVGDMLRALGDKSADGTSFAAEQIITGAFQTVAGTVVSTDPAANQVVIKNLQTNKNVTISIGPASVLKKFPTEQAEMLARMQAMQAMGGGGARPMGGGQGAPGGRTPGAANPGGSPGGQGGQGRPGMGGGPGGARGGSVEDMLERSPSITVADLKAGDIIALSSTKTDDDTRLKAIKLFAGVEPFLRAAQASGGGRGGRGGQGGVDGGFSIPGLDGPGFP